MSPWSRRPLVLLAEDDPDIRRLVATLLERWGYEVAPAESGREALAPLASRPPALAVLDVGIPSPDGIELTRTPRADPELATVPVLLLTAHAERSRAAECAAAGATGHLTKPFRAQALRKAIWAALPVPPERAA